MAEKKKGIGLIGLIGMVISSCIGSGVFAITGQLAGVASPGAVLIAWLIVGVGFLALAFSLNNLTEKRSDLHGIFSYADAGWGPLAGFISSERNYAENLLFLAGALLAIGYAVRSLALRFEKPPADESDERAARIGDNLLIYARRHGLTDRESEVLRLILQGKDNQNIASTLTIAPSTVKVYVHRLLQKTGCENRQGLIQDFWRSA